MTLSDILESNNIRSDRYAMAAISHICKAFGYKTYSKESWPWGKDMQFEWQYSKGINTDVLEAELLLEKARTTALEESNKDNNIYNIILEDPSLISLHNKIKNLNNRLSNLKDDLSNSNNTSSNISNISTNTISKIDDISQIKSEQDAPIALGITTTYPETAIATASGGGGHGTLMWTNGNSLNNVGSKTTKAYWTGDFNYYQSPYSNEIILTVNKSEQAAPIAVGSITTYPTVALASIEDDRGHGTLLWTNGDKLENTVGTISTQAYWTGDSNYKESPKSNTISLTVIKFTPSITLSATNRAYNGSPLYATAFIEVPEGGKQIKGTIYYGTSEGASTYNITYDEIPVSLSSVSITDVSAQTVYAYFVPDSTCNDVYNTSSSVNKTFNISKAQQNPPIATGDTTTYPTVALASAMGGGGQGTLNWTNGSTLDTTGTKKTKAYWSGNSNYNASVYSNEVTLTVNKFTTVITLSATNRAYNGSPLYATAFIEVPEGGKQIKGTIYYGTSEGASTYNVTYNGTPVNLNSVSITDVGAQTVYAYFVPDSTCNDVYNNSESVNKTYVISKADQEAPVATGDTTTYPASASASASGGGSQGELRWTNGSTLYTAGRKLTKAYWSGNSNYNESPQSNEVCITVWKATPTVTLSVTDRAYNGSALYATATASVNGVIFYGDSEGATTYNIGYSGAPVNLINISITDTGQQTVWAYLVPTDSLNYNNSDNVSKTFNINKDNLSASVSMPGWTYGGTASNPSVSGNSENGSVTYTYKVSTADDSTYTLTKPSNAGTYTVRAQIAETTNYNATTVTNAFTIAKANISPIVSISNWTYADTAPEPSVTGNSGNGSVTYTYKVSTAADSTYTSTKPFNAGTYIVRAVIDATSNYNGATVTNTFTINKVTPTVVSPVPNVLTYNKSSQELATIGSTNFGVLKYSLDESNWSTNMLTAINGNSYRLYYKVDGDSNINDVPINSILCSIAEQRVTTPTIILSQNSYNYNGSQCKPTPTVKDDEGDIIDPIEYNVSYLNNINAGTATVIISDIVNGNYYIEGTQTFTITQDNLSASVSMTGWTYGETSSNPSVSGNIGNGNVTYTYKVSTADDSTYASTKPSNAGTYTVRAIIDSTTNYNGATVTNTFTIAKANISPVVSMLDWTYGETASNPSVSGNSGNGSVTYTYKVSTADDSTYTSTKPSNAGTYTVRAVIDATSNYNGAIVANTFTIAKAPGSVTTVPIAKSGLIYNDSAQALINAGSGTGTMYYSLSPNSGFNTSIPTATNARDYTVYYYAAASTNYNQSAIGSISAKIVENYFRLTTLENGTTFTFTNVINYSLDYGTTWTSLTANTNTPSLNVNTDILFKGTLTPTSSDGIGKFSSNSKTFNVSGNVMSLLYGDDFKNKTSFLGYDAFKNLLKNSKVVNASNLVLPATRLVSGCYYSMFFDCTSLTTAPVLPATTLAEYCYGNMFNGCTNLTTAPELPATTLAENCYYHMFQGCTSLTTAPELPATTLATYCYRCMFEECTSLTTAPELPATTLAENCYESMFQCCTSLTTAPVLHATTLAGGCYKQMFYGCTSLTTAPVLPATTLVISCYNYMFFDCTSLTTAPVLPATTLANYCYEGMFIGCTSLTTAPELPATTLASGCYSSMFSRCQRLTSAPELPATTLASSCYRCMFLSCTNLTTAPELPATTVAGGCYYDMFFGCTNLTIAPELPATTLAQSCYDGMFSNCTSLTTAPVLPATTLAGGCYGYMFSGCTSLTTAPVLPATTLVEGCYSYMFIGCSSLNYIKALFITTPDTTYTDNWVNGVAASGTFVKSPDCYNVDGVHGMPTGWTIIKEYVEIGGIKWATLNVGATSVTDAGLYFQWGDTQGYTASQVNSRQKYFGWSDYKYGNNTSSPGAAGMIKYNASDGKTVLDASDDAARANLGGQWRMPTTAEWQALIATVDVVRTTDYRGTGVTGLVCTNKTDGVEVLFLPASGYCDNASVYDVNDRGFYWSSSLNSSNVQNAYSLGFYDGGEQWHTNHSRCHGFPVRGVFD